MKDYKSEIAEFLDGVSQRVKISSLDLVLDNLKKAKYVCVFGMGAISYPIISAIRTFTDIRIDFLCDNDSSKWGQTYHGNLICISPDHLEKYKDEVAILITTQHYKEIFHQLSERGFRRIFIITEYRLLNNDFFKNEMNLFAVKDNAMKLMDILEDDESREILLVLIKNWFDFDIQGDGYKTIYSGDQYYPKDVIHLREDESFVDAGAYNGDTLLDFIERSKHKFNKIYAFELDKSNFQDMEKAVNQLDVGVKAKIQLYQYGLLDEEKIVNYETGGSGMQSTCINMISSANDSGKTVRLSEVLGDKKVTFIKMDIEGAELKALQGAEKLIKHQKPKLAICLYHKPQHLWEIPLYLKSVVPEYKIFIRHHTPLEYETVCYAVPQHEGENYANK